MEDSDSPGDSMGPSMVAAMSAILVLSLTFLLLRVICKLRCGKKLGLDDSILVVSWILMTVFIALSIASTYYGMGMHLKDLRSVDFVYANKLITIGQFFALGSIAVAKSSFCVTLLRLSASTWQKWLLWTIIVTTNLMLWLCGIFLFTACTPTAKKWDPSIPGKCWSYRAQIYFALWSGAYSAFTDFVLALFPWFLIWNLQMRKLEKIGLCVAMSMGVLSGIVATIKTSYMVQSLRWNDFAFTFTRVVISSAAETAAIIIASSIPFLRLAIKKAVPTRSPSHAIRCELVFSDSMGGSGRGSGGRHSGASRRVVRLFSSEHSGGLHSATGTMNRVVVETRTADGGDDDASDRSTLDDAQLKSGASIELNRREGGGGIMWTREVTVEHHDRRDVESLEEKMGREEEGRRG